MWTPKGLITVYTLFVIDLKTRRVHIAGSTPCPGKTYMAQFAHNLTDTVDGFLLPHRFLICDRNSKFSTQFRRTLEAAEIAIVLTPHRAPNCNAFAERFVRSTMEDCLGRMILFGESSLGRAIHEYVEHYNRERPHQGVATGSSSKRPAHGIPGERSLRSTSAWVGF